jgi:hypothetical protein
VTSLQPSIGDSLHPPIITYKFSKSEVLTYGFQIAAVPPTHRTNSRAEQCVDIVGAEEESALGYLDDAQYRTNECASDLTALVVG